MKITLQYYPWVMIKYKFRSLTNWKMMKFSLRFAPNVLSNLENYENRTTGWEWNIYTLTINSALWSRQSIIFTKARVQNHHIYGRQSIIVKHWVWPKTYSAICIYGPINVIMKDNDSFSINMIGDCECKNWGLATPAALH